MIDEIAELGKEFWSVKFLHFYDVILAAQMPLRFFYYYHWVFVWELS